MNDYEFGNYLYELRKKAGLSQTELAWQLGVTNKAVSKWENGRAKPSTETLRKLASLFGVSVDTLERKMTRYGITFSSTGWAEKRLYTIHNIVDPFKLFAILELGFDGNTDFTKLRNFYYHFFEDELFMTMPDEVKEVWMKQMGDPLSRQTIANYTRRLETNNLINRYTKNYIYYFANKQEQRFCDHDEYAQAWSEYWENIRNKVNSFDAIAQMRMNYGGVARKQPIPEINGIYNEKIEYMLSLIQQSIESEYEG